VFLALGAIYFLTTTAYLPLSSDEGVNLALTESIAKFGRFDVEQMATITRAVPAEFGLDGLHYSKYGLSQAVLSVPLYWLAQAVAGFGIIPTVILFNALATAAAGAFVYLAARQLGHGPGLSVLLALLYGLASPAWVYSKRYMSEPLTALALIAAAYFALRAERGGVASSLLAGVCFAVGALNKVANLAFAPLFVAYLALAAAPAGASWVQRLRAGRGWWRALGFAAPVALAAATAAYYNWARFGDVFHTGYGPNEGFTVPIWEGLAGLLFSPGKSAFIYFPLLLLLPFWARACLRRRPAAGWFFVALIAAHFLLYATWWIWWGGWNWGVRFLVSAWPFAVLLLGDGLRGLRRPSGWALGRLAPVVVLVALSLGVQVLGVLVDHSVFLASLMPLSLDPDRLTLTDPARQPVLNQLRYLTTGPLDFGWLLPGKQPTVDVPTAGALAAGVLASLVALALTLWRRGRGFVAPLALVAATAVVACGTNTYLERVFAREDGSARQVQAELRTHALPDAQLIYLAPSYTTLWEDAAKVAIPTWGRHEESPLQPATQARLEKLAAASEEVWVVSENPPGAPENGIERWLAAHAFRQSERWYGPFRLASYRTGRAGEAGFVPLTANLGNDIRLLGYTVEDADRPRRPGETVNVTLRWQAERRPAQDYTVFVHLLDEREKVWGQQDVAPGGGYAPTSGWQPGQVLDDRYGVPFKADAPAGVYRLEIGLYLPATGARLPLLDDKGAEIGNRILLPTTLQLTR